MIEGGNESCIPPKVEFMQQVARFMIVISGCLLCCSSCEYAKPSKATSDKKAGASELPIGDSTSFENKPAYVVADPAHVQELTGINGGQRFTFDPPDYSGEWTQDNNTNLVRFFIVDRSGSRNVSVAADSFCIKSGDNLMFSLDPDNGYNSSGSDSFSLEDRNLALAMNSTVEVVLQVQGKSYRAILNESAPSAPTDSTAVDQ